MAGAELGRGRRATRRVGLLAAGGVLVLSGLGLATGGGAKASCAPDEPCDPTPTTIKVPKVPKPTLPTTPTTGRTGVVKSGECTYLYANGKQIRQLYCVPTPPPPVAG